MRLKALISTPAVAFGLTTGALAADYEVTRQLQLALPSGDVWNYIGDFCDIDDWHPAFTSCVVRVIDGRLHRQLTGADGAEVIERRIAQEPGLSYTYRTVSGPMPVENFTATLSVEPGDMTRIVWAARFSSDDPGMEAAVGEMMDAGLAAIEMRLD